jgi:hypothetical protein
MRNLWISLALICLITGSCNSPGGEVVYVNPEENKGFYFPYFLFIPENSSQSGPVHVVVEPNNSGFVDDDLQKHIEKAERTATLDSYMGNYVARAFNYPLVVPVFPRTKSDWKTYTHSLDRDVMMQKDNPLERIDLQLLAMVKDARQKLELRDIRTEQEILLTGFSASGTFANRFTLLHPDQVLAVAAGGLNGLLMLPLDSLGSELLKYPVGIGDIKALTNEEFKENSFIKTPQFYFMGALDDNDAIPYDDAFDQEEREQIYRLLGREMMPKRWEKCKELYNDLNVNATIKVYEETGHEHPEKVKREVVEFFMKIRIRNLMNSFGHPSFKDSFIATRIP